MSNQRLSDKIYQYIDLIKKTINDTDERMARLTGESIEPSEQADMMASSLDSIAGLVAAHSLSLFSIREDFLNKNTVVKTVSENTIINTVSKTQPLRLDVDTRKNSVIIRILLDPAEFPSNPIRINDKHNTFSSNPCIVVFGEENPGTNEIDGTTDIIKGGDPEYRGRKTMDESGKNYLVSMSNMDTPVIVVAPNQASHSSTRFVPEIYPYSAGSDCRVQQSADGDLTIYGKGKADGVFKPWPVNVYDRDLSSFIVSSFGVNDTTGEIDPTTRSGKMDWVIQKPITESFNDAMPSPMDRHLFELETGEYIRIDLRKNLAKNELGYIRGVLYDMDMTQVFDSGLAAKASSFDAIIPAGSSVGQTAKIVKVAYIPVDTGDLITWKYTTCIFMEVTKEATGNVELVVANCELTLLRSGVPGSKFNWGVIDQLDTLITIKNGSNGQTFPYALNILSGMGGVEVSYIDQTNATPTLNSWVYKCSNGTFSQSTGSYGSFPISGMTLPIGQDDLVALDAVYRGLDLEKPVVYIRDGGTIYSYQRRGGTGTSAPNLPETPYETIIETMPDGNLIAGSFRAGICSWNDSEVRFHYANDSGTAGIAIDNIMDVTIVPDIENEYILIKALEAGDSERLYVYEIPENPGNSNTDNALSLVEMVSVPDGIVFQSKQTIYGASGGTVLFNGPDSLTEIKSTILRIEPTSRDFYWRAHFTLKTGGIDNAVV